MSGKRIQRLTPKAEGHRIHLDLKIGLNESAPPGGSDNCEALQSAARPESPSMRSTDRLYLEQRLHSFDSLGI